MSEELGLKVLERKRLLVALGGDPSIAAFDEIAETAPRHLSQAVGAVTMHLRIRTITGNVIDINANASDSVLTTKTKLRQMDNLIAARPPCDVFDSWVRWERGQVGI